MKIKSANELAAIGLELARAGHTVAYLHPNQEYLAVEGQLPFVRIEPITNAAEDLPSVSRASHHS